MDDDKPTLGSIAKEFATPGYVERARARKRAAKTGWDLIFLPIGFALIGGLWYVFTNTALALHDLIHPGNPIVFVDGEPPITFAVGLMMMMPAFAAVPLGFMASNVLQWLIPPARRAGEKKAKGVKGASFREAQRGLFKLAQLLVPLGLGAALLGALL